MTKTAVLLLLLPGFALADYTMPIASFTIGFGDGGKTNSSYVSLLGFQPGQKLSADEVTEPRKNNTVLWVTLAVVATAAIVVAATKDSDDPKENCRTVIIVGPDGSDQVRRCD